MIVACCLPLLAQGAVKVYATSGDDYFSVVDPDTNNFLYNITPSFGGRTAGNLHGVAISPNQLTAYMADDVEDGVWVIDTTTDTATNFISIGVSSLRQISIDPNGTKLYFPDQSGGRVHVVTISDGSVATVSGGAAKPSSVAFDPTGTKFYVSDVGFGASSVYVYRVSDNSSVGTISATRAQFIAISSLGVGYVPDVNGADVYTFSTTTDAATGTITTSGSELNAPAFTNDGLTAYVASESDDTLQVIVNGVQSSTIPISISPWAVVVNPFDNTQLYMTPIPEGTVSVVQGGVEVGTPSLQANLTTVTYLAFLDLPYPEPPRFVKGKVINNRYVLQTDLVYQVSWTASISSDVVSYNIYRDSRYIANVGALQNLIYNDHNRTPGVSNFYEVRAVDFDGYLSDPVSITLP
ncbi:MAG: hypothetical protein S4CHLAM102_02690 [Chlamydiia bacterium]|nr:hypothetical protein [Chlamydiia bacterium]